LTPGTDRHCAGRNYAAAFRVIACMRVQLRSITFLLAAALALAGVRILAQRPASVAEQYLFSAANLERAQRGLPALRWDAGLYRAAEGHAAEMAERASISHQYPGEHDLGTRARQQGARFSVVAENVAEAPTAIRIHDAWMQSPEHRANLLDTQVDSVGISVLRRGGELYAVEDFDRSVANLSFDAQERTVADLVSRIAPVTVLSSNDDARRTCNMDTGYAGARRPWFVMRYTTGDIRQLPDTLKGRLATGKYGEAMVGACAAHGTQAFSAFNIAVLLYP
jgi:uncharacterized protein YkwD